ncbi:MAG: leucine-rich repeat domain-containing protein, partial [Thiomargarita sp.]|nr:leucine-rich repeat domain-containing protein [Thiomargarita sp.]
MTTSNELSDLSTVSTVSETKPVDVSSNTQVDNWTWWNKLNEKWKDIFKKAINIDKEPSEREVVKIVNLRILICHDNKLSDLEPLHQLTNLNLLLCIDNKISDLEPLRHSPNLEFLYCYNNKISDLEPLHQSTNLRQLYCYNNKISDLEP